MYKIKTLFIGLVALSLFACKQKATPTKVDDTKGYKYFGAEINDQGTIGYDELLVKMETMDSVEAKVVGKIEGVCQVKGCWMNVVSETNAEAEPMFVKFKDYGFFMPLECAGQTAIMRGKAYREITSVDELRHYAEDEGKSPEEIAQITEPMEELKFLADGVILK